MEKIMVFGNIDILNRENLYKLQKEYYDNLKEERYKILELREELEIPQKIRSLLEESIKIQNWIIVKSDGEYSTLPHQYVVRHKWNNSVISFDFFCETLRHYSSIEIWKGTIENWIGRKGEYLRIGNFKYFDLGWPLEVTTVLNRENSKFKTHDEYKNYPKGEI